MGKVVKLKVKKVRREQKWARSCFFGAPDLPLHLLDEVDDDEIFVAQINLKEFIRNYNSPLLPHKGMLYFFIKLDGYKPIIRYQENIEYDEKLMSRVDFNDLIEFDIDITKEYKISFIKQMKKKGTYMMEEDKNNPSLHLDEIVLLHYNQEELPQIMNTDGALQFIISKNDLLNRNYDKVRLGILR